MFEPKLIVMEINAKMPPEIQSAINQAVHSAVWVEGGPLLWCLVGNDGAGDEDARVLAGAAGLE